jgi:hypothetical protein
MLSSNNPASLMEVLEHRKNIRVRRNFPVRLFMEDLNLFFEGITTNLSQGGAFIKSKNVNSCQAGALAILTFFLPPDFTGQNETIGLQGDTVITWIDQENKGIAVEFIKTFRELERVNVPDLPEKSDSRIAY